MSAKCDCGGDKCDPTRLYSQKSINTHRRKVKNAAYRQSRTYCDCGAEFCEPGVLYTIQDQILHKDRVRQRLLRAAAARSEEVNAQMAIQTLSSTADMKTDMVSSSASAYSGSINSSSNTATATSTTTEEDPMDTDDLVCMDFAFDSDHVQSDNDHVQSDNEPGDTTDPTANQHTNTEPQMEPDQLDHLNSLPDMDFDEFEEEMFEDDNVDEQNGPEQEDAPDDPMDEPLGDGLCLLTLVTLLFLWQKRYNINGAATRGLFRIMGFVLRITKITKRFPSYDGSRKKFQTNEGCKSEIRHVCPKCEYLYKQDEAQKCGNVTAGCQEDRYLNVNGTKVPRKKFFWWSIIEQLKLRSGWTGFMDRLVPVPAEAHDDKAPDVVSSKVIPYHTRENIQVATQLGSYIFIIALACDGFNPWRGVQYTIWFLAFRVLNQKVKYTAKTNDLITVGIIPGPTEPKTLQFYANDIVLQLLLLQANQVTVPGKLADGSIGNFFLRAYLIGLIGDYPAICKMLNVQGVGQRERERDRER